MPAAARSKMRHTRVFRSRRSSAPLHNIFNKHMRNNTHLLMQHGMHNMCNALRIRADVVESVLRVFFIHNNTIAMGFCNAYNIHIKMAQGHAPIAHLLPKPVRTPRASRILVLACPGTRASSTALPSPTSQPHRAPHTHPRMLARAHPVMSVIRPRAAL